MATRPWLQSDHAAGVLAAWHEPSNNANVTLLSGTFADGTISADKDLSANKYDETAGYPLYPGYVENGINGLSAEVFSETTGFNLSSLPAGAPIRTFVIVCKPTIMSRTQTLYAASAPGGLQFRIEADGSLGFVKQNVAYMAASNKGLLLAGNAYIVSGSYNQNTGAYSFRVNGAPAGSGNAPTTLDSTTTAVVGYNPNYAGETLSGYLGNRVALNSDALSDIQLSEGRFASQYKIRLPDGHPYSAAAPTVNDGATTARRRRFMAFTNSFNLSADAQFDPANKAAGVTLSDKNRTAAGGSANNSNVARAIKSRNNSKYYFEMTFLVGGVQIGICNASQGLNTNIGENANGYSYDTDGFFFLGGNVSSAPSATPNDVIGFAVDFNGDGFNQILSIYKNGVKLGSLAISISGSWFPACNIRSANASAKLNTTGPFINGVPAGYQPWSA